MKLALSIDGKSVMAECDFARSSELGEIAAWRRIRSIPAIGDAADAAEFAELAGKRWRTYRRLRRTVSSLEELQQSLQARPKEEFVFLTVIRCQHDQLPGTLGFCLFRRTWCNNLTLDFIASHPSLLTTASKQVKGVGIGLMAFVAQLAVHLDSPAIWCETTESSAKRYAQWFSLTAVDDVLRADREAYRLFLIEAQRRWKKTGLPIKVEPS